MVYGTLHTPWSGQKCCLNVRCSSNSTTAFGIHTQWMSKEDPEICASPSQVCLHLLCLILMWNGKNGAGGFPKPKAESSCSQKADHLNPWGTKSNKQGEQGDYTALFAGIVNTSAQRSGGHIPIRPHCLGSCILAKVWCCTSHGSAAATVSVSCLSWCGPWCSNFTVSRITCSYLWNFIIFSCSLVYSSYDSNWSLIFCVVYVNLDNLCSLTTVCTAICGLFHWVFLTMCVYEQGLNVKRSHSR